MLICTVTYDTPENHRAPLTEITLRSLHETVDYETNPVYVSDNGSTDPRTIELLAKEERSGWLKVIRNGENLGTAKAVNQVIRLRKPGQLVCKVDNDMDFNECNWVEKIELVARKVPDAGIIGAKLKMIGDRPDNPVGFYKTELVLLPHEGSEMWCPVEFGHHITGACQAYTPKLLDKIGGLRQAGNKYAWDDVIVGRLSELLGFKNVWVYIDVDHIDPGYKPYQLEKNRIVAESQGAVWQLVASYTAHPETIYVEP